jgi:BASS family bile acid:Na+ symporter
MRLERSFGNTAEKRMGPGMVKIARLLKNRDFLFLLATALGLVSGVGARRAEPFALPALAVVMTLSTMGIRGNEFRPLRGLGSAAAAGLGLNYLVLSGFYLAASGLFPSHSPLRAGFILLAAAPPAVAVIPFTDFYHGEPAFSLAGTISAYLGALLIAPLIGAVAWGTAAVPPMKLIWILVELVVLPLLASRVLIRTGWDARLLPVRGVLTNWCYFVAIYAMIGLNRGYILGSPVEVLPVIGVGIASTFGLGVLIDRAGEWIGVGVAGRTSSVLLGTLKNYGLAGGLALSLFGDQEALPAVVCGTVMIPFAVWLGFRDRRRRERR